MTLKQWLKHLIDWLITFPLPRKKDHCWLGLAGSNHFECLSCGAEMDE
jgi:hypothetical protein